VRVCLNQVISFSRVSAFQPETGRGYSVIIYALFVDLKPKFLGGEIILNDLSSVIHKFVNQKKNGLIFLSYMLICDVNSLQTGMRAS